ncbi:rod shape-determining protein MreC [Algicella marina]|uniref:Cell shape-determining protein MreC n=1 Tax=Algicella marina TaxID=2683284 RepID=A0A6P1SYE8_9RHOB|nr:rod shape-determining protein MreC [Algicella marina]QHQ35498.1 rod shape-determining protein MreC [Algicella marina]
MAKGDDQVSAMWRTIRRILITGISVLLLALFLLWRIDNPRVENIRIAILDRVVPNVEWSLNPITYLNRMIGDYQTMEEVYAQNRELRRELQRMKGWREAALQLEEKNARLRALNNVRLSPRLRFVAGEVIADSGSPFRQSGLLNIGRIDGVKDGWAVVDGLGLVGRISGVGESTSRVILLTDINARVPAIMPESGQRALVSGDNTNAPLLEFVEDTETVRPGDRVMTSGDGGLFPADILIGTVAAGPDGRLRVRLAADYRRLEFIRVLREAPTEEIVGPGALITPPQPADALESIEESNAGEQTQ